MTADDDNDGGGAAAVLSRSLWRSHFGADAALIGREIVLSGHAVTVVGVVDGDFRGIIVGERIDIWLSIGSLPRFAPTPSSLLAMVPVRAYVRLADGVRTDQATAEIGQLLQRRTSLHQLANSRYPLTTRDDADADRHLVRVTVALGAVILLLGWLNMGHLFMSRLGDRAREVRIRLMLGAQRRSLVRLLLAEALWIGIFGGVLATLVAHLLLQICSAFTLSSGITLADLTAPPGWYRWGAGFVLATALVIAAGLRPSVGLVGLMRTEGQEATSKSRLRIRSMFLALQVAGFLVLLTVGLLFVGTVHHTLRRNYEFDIGRTLSATVQPRTLQFARAGGAIDAARRHQAFREFIAAVKTVQGVSAVALGPPPFVGPDGRVAPWVFRHDGGTTEVLSQRLQVSLGYFETAGIQIIAGRDFSTDDATRAALGPGAMIVSEAMAGLIGVGRNAIGSVVTLGNGESYVVVGIARDAVRRDVRNSTVPAYFVLTELDDRLASLTLLVRTEMDPSSTAASVRTLADTVFPDAARREVETTQSAIHRQIAAEVVGAAVFSWFGATAALLCLVGVFGLASTAARERMKEWAIRLAIGGSPWLIVRLAMRTAGAPVAIGVVVGLPISYLAVTLVRHHLVDAGYFDAGYFLVLSAVVISAGIATTWCAARRVGRVDPASLIRQS